jgi:hypothetical protein
LFMSGTANNYLAGNLGIGITAPTSLLHVSASGYPAITIQGGATAGGGLKFLAGTDTYAELFGEYESANNGMLLFRTRGSGTVTERMRITSAGNVGIGTSSPSFNLHVKGPDFGILAIDTTGGNNSQVRFNINGSILSAITAVSANSSMVFYNNGADRMTIESSSKVTISHSHPNMLNLNSTLTNGGYMAFCRSGTEHGYVGSAAQITSGGSNVDIAMAAYTNLTFATGGALLERMRINSNGNISISYAGDAGYRLYVSGAIYATSNITANSDLTLKKNLKLVENPIDKLNQLNGYLYQWKENDEYQYGVIAQEVEKILPHAVTTGTNGIKGVSYNQLIPVMIEAIKELNAEVKLLKAK